MTTVSLAPGLFTSVPPFAGGRVSRFDLNIENLSSTAASLIVSELGYDTEVMLGAMPASSTMGDFTAFLRRVRDGSDGIFLGTTGESAPGSPSVSAIVHAPGSALVGVPEPLPATPDIPGMRLIAASPNPFSQFTRISFELLRDGLVGATIHDVQGRLVGRLPERLVPAGPGSLEWNGPTSDTGRDGSGVYFYRLTLDGRPAGKGKVLRIE